MRALGAAAMVVALAAGCAQQSADRVGTAAEEGAGPAPSVVEDGKGMTQEDIKRWEQEGYPVGDGGETLGYITRAEMDAQSEAIRERLLVEGTGGEGVAARYLEPPDDVEVAYQVLEAIEVHDPASGQLVGYWGAWFIPVDEYPAELTRARTLTGEFEAVARQK